MFNLKIYKYLFVMMILINIDNNANTMNIIIQIITYV